MKTQTLKIHGLSCAACAKATERATKKLTGVTEANVNFSTEKLSVTYDESQVSVQDIQQAIANAGFQAIEEKTEKEVTIPILGMTCAACSSRVERVLRKMEGISNVTVNLATERATVKYDPTIVRISDLKLSIVF